MNPPPDLGTVAPPPPLPTAKLSTLAVLSLIFGVLGCTLIGGVAGIACGSVALVRIKGSGGQLKGFGLALAGIIVSGVMLLLTPVLAGMLLPALAKGRERALAIQSVTNLKNIGLAARIHAEDNDGLLPAADKWCESLRPELGPAADRLLRRPASPASECAYGYNDAVAGKKAADIPPDVVLFFELETPGCNVAGGPELLRQPRRGEPSVAVCFADGSVRQLTGNQLDDLRWDP